MAIIYGYFDESGKHKDHPVVTFSGVCATEFKIPAFNDAWRSLLRQYGLKSLHMKEASRLSRKVGPRMPQGQTASERIDALKPFADCINEHLELGLIEAWDVKGFNALSEEARRKLGSPDDPYYLAFVRAVTELVEYVQGDDRIALVCDDDTDTAWDCYRHYRGIKRADPDVRIKTVSLAFADDESFPALQAADLVAYLSRREARRLFYGDAYDFPRLYNYLTKEQPPGKMEWRSLFLDEEQLSKLSRAFSKPLKRLNK
jgi:hypothetical protein